MKILLVDNNTRHKAALQRGLKGHHVEVQKYQPGIIFNHKGKDLIILSGGGGEGREVHDKHKGDLWYKDELQFILDCPLPMLGICMGFELMAHAHGAPIVRLDNGFEGFEEFTTHSGHRIKQYESHDFAVQDVSAKHFKVKAASPTNVEIIDHRHKPHKGVQFHPELGGSLQLPELIKQLV